MKFTKDYLKTNSKYILVVPHTTDDEEMENIFHINSIDIDEYIKDLSYLKIESLNPSDRYVEFRNQHHYTTKFWYSKLNDIMNYLNVTDFNINDFVINSDIVEGEDGHVEDFSYLYPVKEYKFKVSGLTYDFSHQLYVEHSMSLDDIHVGSFDSITHCTQHISTLLHSIYFNTKYHQLFRYSHECIKIENMCSKSNRILIISGDSHTVPLIPILSCYFKKVIVLDNRFNFPSNLFYENEEITDILIMLSYNNTLDKFIKYNFNI